MIRTGGSLINAAKAYRDAGAKKIYAITTHGLFTNDAVNKIKASRVIETLVTTNSHPNSLADNGKFLKVESIAPLILEHLLEET